MCESYILEMVSKKSQRSPHGLCWDQGKKPGVKQRARAVGQPNVTLVERQQVNVTLMHEPAAS